jgi:hypothetical protein
MSVSRAFALSLIVVAVATAHAQGPAAGSGGARAGRAVGTSARMLMTMEVASGK